MSDRLQFVPAPPRWRPSPGSAVCILSGVMLTTAMPPLRATAPLALLALALLFHVLRDNPYPGRAAFLFALGHAAPLLAWLFYLDPAKSIPTRALVPLQAIAAILFVALHYLLLGLAVGWIRRWIGPRAVLPLLPVLWLGVELLRSAGELGFPWCLVGAAWLDTPLQPLYAAAGEIGLGAATALSAAALVAIADLLRRAPPRSAHAWGLIAAALVLWGGLWLGSRPVAFIDEPGAAPAPGAPVHAAEHAAQTSTETQLAALSPAPLRKQPLRVASVQADVAQGDKWDDAKIDSTRLPYTTLTRQAALAGAELVVWAETAVPAYLRFDQDLLQWLRGLVRDAEIALLAGFLDAHLMADQFDREGNPIWARYNTAGLFCRDGWLLGRYDKHHLVPLGEAMPFQRFFPWLGRIDVGQAEWTPGAPPGPISLPTEHGEVPLVALICFEAIFADLARQAVRRGGRVLVNITNDGWFGHRAGPLQHAALSRIRAAECGVPLVRSANNGVSFIADSRGVVLADLGLHRRGVILADIEIVPRGTWFVRTGIWPVVAFMLLWSPVAIALARYDERAITRVDLEHPSDSGQGVL